MFQGECHNCKLYEQKCKMLEEQIKSKEMTIKDLFAVGAKMESQLSKQVCLIFSSFSIINCNQVKKRTRFSK